MSKDSDRSKNDLARLQADFEEERKIKETLEESVSDLRRTVYELQERLQGVDGEGNEWRTRYESQLEVNGQLERQSSLLREKLEIIRGNPMDRLASIRSYEDMPEEMLKEHLKLQTEEKLELQTQLRNCHLQMEQEGKAFHKTNDERRAYLSEIAMSSTHEARRRRISSQPQRAPGSQQSRKQTSRKTEADSKKGKEGEEHGGGEHLKGGGGGDSAIERRKEMETLRERRLPSKHYLKHNR
ncbi:coiled-coil domain-containing protein 169-like [Cololabis saira]|uniref:coiled-coil domain-containing protein 169-like n=1 Tax=Cololabis saira TaxID=129043 RepID=UPI002AD37122|nr:coiled-coil domain-containing protein 169-like [Cololabis saira]